MPFNWLLDSGIEVREYPDMTLVATGAKLDAQGRDGSFIKLFRYISGAIESDKKISMTTPVFMENDKADSAVQIGFVMPKDVAVEGVPSPTESPLFRSADQKTELCRWPLRTMASAAPSN